MAVGKRRRGAALVIGAVVALGTSACLQDPSSSGSGAGGGDVTAQGGSTDGDGVVTILGAFGGDEQALFEDSLAEFEEQSGIDVQYTADSNFTVTVQQRASSGDSADISIFPQPGGLLQLAESGDVQPIDTFLDYDALDSTLIGNFLPASRLNGRVYAAPMRMAVKSLVWYDKANYEAAGGTTTPTSYDDLQQNLNQQVAGGGTPWCMGWGSDAATGWVGTDWIEDYVLRMYGPDVYDQWVTHDIPFNDERIVAAFDKYAEIAKAPQEVLGGARGIVATPFGEAMNPAFEDDPTCYVMKQGNFISGFFPEDVQENLDDEVGVFSFPGFTDAEDPTVAATGDADATAPVLIGGDLAALMNGDDEDAIEVMRFLTSPEFGGPWAQGGGWISPHRTFDASQYANDTTRAMAQIAIDAPVARYDASDSMPSAVGSGAWWTGMVDWVQGASSEDVTAEIEAAWPADDEAEGGDS